MQSGCPGGFWASGDECEYLRALRYRFMVWLMYRPKRKLALIRQPLFEQGSKTSGCISDSLSYMLHFTPVPTSFASLATLQHTHNQHAGLLQVAKTRQRHASSQGLTTPEAPVFPGLPYFTQPRSVHSTPFLRRDIHAHHHLAIGTVLKKVMCAMRRATYAIRSAIRVLPWGLATLSV